MEINWVLLFQTSAAVAAAIGTVWAVMTTRHSTAMAHERDRRDAELAALGVREQSDLNRERQADDAELGYVDRLQLRIHDLEQDNDRLRRERETRSDQNNVHVRIELAAWRDLALRAQKPLEDSNVLSEEALKLVVVETGNDQGVARNVGNADPQQVEP